MAGAAALLLAAGEGRSSRSKRTAKTGEDYNFSLKHLISNYFYNHLLRHYYYYD